MILDRVTLLVAVLTCSTACAHTNVKPEVERIWKKNEAIVDDAAARRKYREDELLSAVSFFERTTGLRSEKGLDEKGLIVVPTDDLSKDLVRWREWYITHRDLLYVDAATGEVKVSAVRRR